MINLFILYAKQIKYNKYVNNFNISIYIDSFIYRRITMSNFGINLLSKPRKKKLLIIALAMILISAGIFYGYSRYLTKRVNNNTNDSEPIFIKVGPECAVDKGFYFSDGEPFIRYYDFASGKTTFLCNKPNCKHNESEDPKQCNAYDDFVSTMFYYNGKLYLFTRELNERGELTGNMLLYKQDMDGKNRKLVRNFGKGDISNFIIFNGELYYGKMEVEEKEDESGLLQYTGRTKLSFCAYNFSKNKIRELKDFGWNYSAAIMVCQGYDTNRSIYFSYSYYDQNILDKSLNLSSEDIMKHHKIQFYSYKDGQVTQQFKGLSNSVREGLIIIDDTFWFTEKAGDNLKLKSLNMNSNKVDDILTIHPLYAIWDEKITCFELLENGEYITLLYDFKSGTKYIDKGRTSIIAETKNGFVLDTTEFDGEDGQVYLLPITPDYISKEDYYKKNLELYSSD